MRRIERGEISRGQCLRVGDGGEGNGRGKRRTGNGRWRIKVEKKRERGGKGVKAVHTEE